MDIDTDIVDAFQASHGDANAPPHQENPELLIFCLFVLFAKNKTK
jgi:hypothetical protein